jgi:Spy/CpxP family protein refolding chaperone
MLPLLCLPVLSATPTPPLPPIPVLKNAKRLNLTEEQIKTLTEIQKRYAKELSDRRKALMEASMSLRSEIQAVLTDEQKAKAKALKLQ